MVPLFPVDGSFNLSLFTAKVASPCFLNLSKLVRTLGLTIRSVSGESVPTEGPNDTLRLAVSALILSEL